MDPRENVGLGERPNRVGLCDASSRRWTAGGRWIRRANMERIRI